MKQLYMALGFVLFLTGSVAAQPDKWPVVYGTPEEMQEVTLVKENQKNYEKCIQTKVAPLRTRLEKLSAQLQAAQRLESDEHGRLINGANNVGAFERQHQETERLNTQKEKLENTIRDNERECSNKFSPREWKNERWYNRLTMGTIERQYNLNQLVLSLLRKNQLKTLEEVLDGIPIATSGRIPPEKWPSNGVFAIGGWRTNGWYWGNLKERITYEAKVDYGSRKVPVVSTAKALFYGLTTYYKELYGQDIWQEDAVHYREFMNKYKGTAFASEVEFTLSFAAGGYDGTELNHPFHYADDVGKTVIRMMRRTEMVLGDPLRVMGLLKGALDVSLSTERYDDIVSSRPAEIYSNGLKDILDHAQKESVRLGREDLFYQLKRQLYESAFPSFSDDWCRYYVFSFMDGFDWLATGPITEYERKRIGEMIQYVCQGGHLDGRFDDGHGTREKSRQQACRNLKIGAAKRGYYEQEEVMKMVGQAVSRSGQQLKQRAHEAQLRKQCPELFR